MCHCLSEFGDEHESIFLPFSNTLMPEFAVESARKEASKWSESAASHLPFWHIRAGPGMSTCLSVWRCDKFAKTETFWTSADSNGPAGCVSTSEPSAWFVFQSSWGNLFLVDTKPLKLKLANIWDLTIKLLFNQMLIASLKSTVGFRSGARWKGNDTWLTPSITSRAWGSFRRMQNVQKHQTACTDMLHCEALIH